MPTLKDCIITAPSTGACEIDIEKAKKYFDKHCFISKWQGEKGDEYRLVRTKANARNFNHVKVTISEEDALTIIDALNMYEITSRMFNRGSTFHAPQDSDF
jgi:hypothetical protein|tara:strand:+ start:175 stop:477 length:303 start_codon:yes stop_codon:yes gene_type:complete